MRLSGRSRPSDAKLSDILRAPGNLDFYLKFIRNYLKLKNTNLTWQMTNDKCAGMVMAALLAELT